MNNNNNNNFKIYPEGNGSEASYSDDDNEIIEEEKSDEMLNIYNRASQIRIPLTYAPKAEYYIIDFGNDEDRELKMQMFISHNSLELSITRKQDHRGQTHILSCRIDNDVVNLSFRDQECQTVLHYIFGFPNDQIVNDFIKYYLVDVKKHISIDVRDMRQRSILHFACQAGNLKAVHYLIDEERFNPLRIRDVENNTALHYACRNGQYEVAKYLIDEKNMNIKDMNKCGENALFAACCSGNLRLIKYLLDEKNAEVVPANATIKRSAFHAACQSGYFDIVKYFLEELAADLLFIDYFKCTAFIYACESGNFELIHYLVSKQDILRKFSSHLIFDITDEQHRKAALCAACKRGNLKVIHYLIDELGMKEYAKGYDSTSRFVFIPGYDMLQYMRSAKIGLYVNTPSELYDNDPLHIACDNGHIDVVKYLLEDMGARMNTRNKDDKTILHAACEAGHLDIVRYLLEVRHMEMAPTCYCKSNMIHLACMSGNTMLVRYLLAKNCDLFSLNEDGHNALHYASLFGHLHVVKYLLDDKGILKTSLTPSAKGFADKKLMQYIAQSGNIQLLRYAIECKENTDIYTTHANETILHVACDTGNIEVIRYLIRYRGIESSIRDNNNYTPMAYACERNNIECVQYLLEDSNAAKNLGGNSEQILFCCNTFAEEFAIFMETRKESFLLLLDEQLTVQDKIKICKYATKLSIVFARYLKHLESPISVLNNLILADDNGNCPLLINFHRILSMKENAELLLTLMKFLNALALAAKQCPTELLDILEIQKKIEIMIDELFSSSIFDQSEYLLLLLTPNTASHDHGDQVNAFDEEGVIAYCLKNDIKVIFGKPQVNNVINNIFLTNLKKIKLHVLRIATCFSCLTSCLFPTKRSLASNASTSFASVSTFGTWLFDTSITMKEYEDEILHTNMHSLRFNPSIVMVLEFFSKSFLLFLVATVAINDYGNAYHSSYLSSVDPVHQENAFTLTEIGLVIMTVSDLTFEWGQIVEHHDRLMEDLYTHWQESEWNRIDMITNLSLIVWMIIRFIFIRIHVQYFYIARVILSLASIPMSFGLLRYFSIYRPLGELVISIEAMASELMNFLIIYLTCILGFGISFYALFYKVDKVYSTSGFTFLTLIQNTLQTFDFDAFLTDSNIVNILGISLLVVFLVLTEVVLLNLLIAKMSSSYEVIKVQSRQEWSFAFAKLVTQYMLLEEHHVFCLLPAPFNLVTIAFLPFQYYGMKWFRISIAGTLSNLFYTYTVAMLPKLYTTWGIYFTEELAVVWNVSSKKELSYLFRWWKTIRLVVTYIFLTFTNLLLLPILYLIRDCWKLRKRKWNIPKSSASLEDLQEGVNESNSANQPHHSIRRTITNAYSTKNKYLYSADTEKQKQLARKLKPQPVGAASTAVTAKAMSMDVLDEVDWLDDEEDANGNGSEEFDYLYIECVDVNSHFLYQRVHLVHVDSLLDRNRGVTRIDLTDDDIARILRPLKSFMRSLAIDALLYNVSEESTKQIAKKVKVVENKVHELHTQVNSLQTELKDMKHWVDHRLNKFEDSMNGNFQEIIQLLKKQHQH